MTPPMWTEVATGPKSRSLRRWAWRILPPKVLRASLALLLASVFILMLGRLVDEYPPVGSCWSDCEQPDRTFDIWDAIF